MLLGLASAIVLHIGGGPELASAMRHGEPNNIFKDVLTLEGRPDVQVLESTTLTGNPAGLLGMGDHLDMTDVCIRLGGGVPPYCKQSFPDLFSHLREVPERTPSPGKKRQLEICNMLAMKVPSFCRLDAKEFHSCSIRRQVLLLENVYVDTGSGGRETGSVFDKEGNVFRTDPFKNHRSLPKVKPELAASLLERARTGVIPEGGNGAYEEVDDMIFAMTTYNAIFYHTWREVLAMILQTIGHAPETATILADPGSSGIDGLLAEVHKIGSTAGCSKRKEKLGECVNDPTLIPRLRWPPQDTIFKVKRLYLPWFESVPISSEKGGGSRKGTSGWRSADEEYCSWYQALPADLLRQDIWKWLDATDNVELVPAPKAKAPARKIVVVHRVETTRRQVKNQEELMAGLNSAFSGDEVVEFVGKENTIKQSFSLFRSADLVIAPHGAALLFELGMTPKANVIELQFEDQRRNSHLTYDFFRLTASNLDVKYALSICNGTFNGGLKANVADVVRLARAML